MTCQFYSPDDALKAREIWTLSSITFECQGGVFHEFGDLLWYLKFG